MPIDGSGFFCRQIDIGRPEKRFFDPLKLSAGPFGAPVAHPCFLFDWDYSGGVGVPLCVARCLLYEPDGIWPTNWKNSPLSSSDTAAL